MGLYIILFFFIISKELKKILSISFSDIFDLLLSFGTSLLLYTLSFLIKSFESTIFLKSGNNLDEYQNAMLYSYFKIIFISQSKKSSKPSKLSGF